MELGAHYRAQKSLLLDSITSHMDSINILLHVGFEVLTAVSTKMAVFWIVAPCSLVEVYQRFRGPCCLHHQGPSGHRRDDGGSKDI
jgi:hypothetical protein